MEVEVASRLRNASCSSLIRMFISVTFAISITCTVVAVEADISDAASVDLWVVAIPDSNELLEDPDLPERVRGRWYQDEEDNSEEC